MNAREELINHIGNREVKYVHVIMGNKWGEPSRTIAGTLDNVLSKLDFEYDEGFGSQELFGNIWYTGGFTIEMNPALKGGRYAVR